MAGATGLDELDGGPPITLPGYGGGRFFDLHTTAEYGEPVYLCVPYDPADYAEAPPACSPTTAASWTDVTLTNDFLARRDLRRARGLRPLRARARLRDRAARDDLRRAATSSSEVGTATFTFAVGRPRRDDAVLARRPAVHDVRVADEVHAPRDRRPQVRGPGDQPDRRLRPDAAHAVRVGGRARPRHDAARHPDPQGPAEPLGERGRAVEFTGIDDQTIDLELEFECLLDGILLGDCDSIPTTPGVPGVPYELELEEGAYGRHTVQVRAIDEMGNVDPTPATRTWTYVDVNSPDTSIEVGPEEETEGHRRDLRVPRRGLPREPAVRLRVLARRRGLQAVHHAAHGRGPRPSGRTSSRCARSARPASSTRPRSGTSG